jgi:hypothetical protein
MLYVGLRAHKTDDSETGSYTVLQKPLPEGSAPEDDASNTSSSLQSSPATFTASSSKPVCIGGTSRVQEIMRRFADHAYASFVQGAPALSHLPFLVQYNIYKALQRNAEILGVVAEYYDYEGISPFTKDGPTLGAISPLVANEWPVNLQPTQLQRSIQHHPWIDVFPWPTFRDNLLQAFEHPDLCDEDELCRDVIEHEELNNEPILIVWGDAWDPRNWEVTSEFLKKWGWLLIGCEGVLGPTNYWRAKRGESPITTRDLYGAFQRSIPAQLRDRNRAAG